MTFLRLNYHFSFSRLATETRSAFLLLRTLKFDRLENYPGFEYLFFLCVFFCIEECLSFKL